MKVANDNAIGTVVVQFRASTGLLPVKRLQSMRPLEMMLPGSDALCCVPYWSAESHLLVKFLIAYSRHMYLKVVGWLLVEARRF